MEKKIDNNQQMIAHAHALVLKCFGFFQTFGQWLPRKGTLAVTYLSFRSFQSFKIEFQIQHTAKLG